MYMYIHETRKGLAKEELMKQVFEDRPYQQEAIAAIAAMETGKHALIQQPTGNRT